MSKTAFKTFPILDFTNLTKKQLRNLDVLFDNMKEIKFKAINMLDTNKARQKLDARLCKILGIKTDDLKWLYETGLESPQSLPTSTKITIYCRRLKIIGKKRRIITPLSMYIAPYKIRSLLNTGHNYSCYVKPSAASVGDRSSRHHYCVRGGGA